ncbi:DUF1501 domain-containing protein [Mucilaginibacter agri]|uniref:DUF1501 domain-containing protein n=1 Tax=Mucilaginibacter agri TaxID=2695265 RepID=A0A966DSL5_9SPHI|nr:DUF1501 domain-containing protein [Mucilaginibacter agri]NCD68456.1 DUF1501 domain-containing protein [Mucilaginibacter agri]
MLSRRGFLKAGGLSLLGVGLMGGIPAFVAEAAASDKFLAPYKKAKTLVCIFQRGAMDGLMAVTPFTDQYLQAARPNLFMSAAKGNGVSLIDLDGHFGLHPSMSAFEPMFREKRLGIVHGIGSPNTTRSHFDAQDYMESGTPFNKGTSSGWLNRAVGLLGHDAITPFTAVSMTSAMPRSLYGDNPSVAISNLNDFTIQMRGNQQGANMAAKSFEDLYDQTSSNLLKQTGKESFDAVKMLQKTDVRNYKPANNAIYPNSPLGNSLKQIAQLIKMDVGLEMAFAESNGWDTHFNQGTDNGIFSRNVADLSNSMMAFWNDLEAYQDDVTVMTMTEFGRTVHQNGTGGTDHGRASCNFILSNRVIGGQVYGDIKPLANENLEDGRDLAVTTDFRSVFSNVADKHLRINNDKLLFPDWDGKAANIMRG